MKDLLVTTICRALSLLFAPWRRRRPLGAPPARILVLKPCCLGDVLMTTPVLAVLRRSYPAASITYAVGGWSRRMVEGNPNIDAFIDTGAVGSGRARLAEFLSLARALRRPRFDLSFVLDRSPALGLLALLAGIPQRVGLDSSGRGFAHTVRVPVHWGRPKHEVDLYLDCLRALSLSVGQPRLEFFPSAEERAWAAAFVASLPDAARTEIPPTAPAGATTRLQGPAHGASDRRVLVAIHPGGAANPGMTLLTKRWHPARFAAVADRLVETYGAHIVLVGAASDADAVQAVQQAMRSQSMPLAGQASLGQLAALYEHCALMLGNDTGAMHLAAAMQTPVVAVFGPSDPRVYGPYAPAAQAVRKDMQCSGRCFVPGRGIAVRCDGSCIAAATVDDVWQAVQAVWPLGVEASR